MLNITIPADERWDEDKNEFVKNSADVHLALEHSLVSMAKWEQKHTKPFISDNSMSQEELIDYIKCMTITQNVDPNAYNFLTYKNIEEIKSYIAAPMTATTISDQGKKGGPKEILTAEVIYACMFELGIPLECQKWHLNRLLMQIRVCSIRQQPQKKMSDAEIFRRNAELNAARRKKFNSKG